MSTLFTRFKRFFKRVEGFIPTRLPVGLSEYERWTASIIDTYGFPANDSIRFSLSVMILHMGSTEAYKPKRYFALSLHKAMANQVVSQVINELKAKQEADRRAEALPLPAPAATNDALN